jgi:hypothetical protein
LGYLLATDQPTAENAENDNERKGGGENPDVGVAKSRATTLLAAHFKQSVAVYVGESGEGRTVGVLTEHLHHTSSRDGQSI